MARRLLLLLATLLAAAPPAGAQQLYRFEVSAAPGYHIFDSQTDLSGTIGFAARAGYWVTSLLSVELEGQYSDPKTNTPLQKRVSVINLGGFVLANFAVGRSTTVLAKLGYGRVSYGTCPSVSIPGSGPCGSGGVVQGGIGARVPITSTLNARVDGTLNRNGSTTNEALHAGFSLMLGRASLTDADGDRVYDRNDKCPGTPPGALVDRHGCPSDQDSDGVPDGLDRCPRTPPGAAVNDVGCTLDADGDGVLDGLDLCPDTPKGATVDAKGCPSDADHDGVPDGLDRCPATPAGATVDALGCPGDADGDGVPDGIDKCSLTPPGTRVDAKGCPAPGAAAAAETGGGRGWIVPGAVFEFRSSVLGAAAYPVLDSVAAMLAADAQTVAEVIGYAHDRLVPSDNTLLSQRRAETVRNYLVFKGIGVSRITAIGRGSQSLIVSDTTDVARTINRRVEIRVTHSP
jgi:hypothetical protein